MSFTSDNEISGIISLRSEIEQFGRFPPVELRIKRLEGGPNGLTTTLRGFLSYKFESSLLTPVDSFTFTFAAPDSMLSFRNYFQEGDIAQLYANDRALATGLIDSVSVEVDPEWGERISINGRDFMCQFEDQDAVNTASETFYSANATVGTVFKALQQQTRIPGLRLQDAPTKPYLFATEAGETKLAALQRFMDPLNVVAWMDPDGKMVIGRPDMRQPSIQQLVMDKARKYSNVIGMRAVLSAATVPNLYVPIWMGQESVQSRISKENFFKAPSERPARLLRLGHFIQKTIIVSNPQGRSAQDLSAVNAMNGPANSILLQAYAKREAARQAVREQIVEVIVPGHFNENGEPYRVDQCYEIYFDRADILGEKMYLYDVQYSLDQNSGQRTSLYFCRLGTIVSDVRYQ